MLIKHGLVQYFKLKKDENGVLCMVQYSQVCGNFFFIKLFPHTCEHWTNADTSIFYLTRIYVMLIRKNCLFIFFFYLVFAGLWAGEVFGVSLKILPTNDFRIFSVIFVFCYNARFLVCQMAGVAVYLFICESFIHAGWSCPHKNSFCGGEF